MLDKIYLSLDEGLAVSALFLDLRKAFDCVDHSVLMKKLRNAGIRGPPLDLLCDYLTNRKQCVRLGNSVSEIEDIDIGIPQGSVLGPLLFLVYVNDIQYLPLSGEASLFADDTGLFYVSKSVNQNVAIMSEDLPVVKDFLDINRLSLNVGKTKSMHFCVKRANRVDEVVLNDHVVDAVREYKYLGLDVDDGLTWQAQTSRMCSKLSSASGILCKLKRSLPKSVLMKLYYKLY